ncbi:MAG: PorT family protein [Bacteroidales bacterium]|nr:PorT family protein [Bacteroidales bacterium]MCF8352746.1 PorT family protein [Bacteroidales bacterium]MCF8375408.1 PorT family protein [Bacteroidales bacterium]MCF8400956.1 PorT family protein [Bacteroidales bacterium]
MKKILLFIFLMSGLAIAPSLKAQVIRGAVVGGFNLTQVDGDEVYGYNQIGFNVGASAIIPLGEHWSVSLENSFTQKGSYQSQQYSDSLFTGEYRLRLNYVQVPLLIHYNDQDRLTFGAGASWGRLVGTKEVEHSGLQPPYSDSIPFDKDDFCVIADLRFRLYQRLHFNFRYSYSLTPIRERQFTQLNGETFMRKQYNNVISVRLIWIFNEVLKTKNPEDQ